MGKYIIKDSKGNSIGASYNQKIRALTNDGATIVFPTKFEKDLVCVVDNGMFAVASYAYDEDKYNILQPTPTDRRNRTWLKYPHAKQVTN